MKNILFHNCGNRKQATHNVIPFHIQSHYFFLLSHHISLKRSCAALSRPSDSCRSGHSEAMEENLVKMKTTMWPKFVEF